MTDIKFKVLSRDLYNKPVIWRAIVTKDNKQAKCKITKFKEYKTQKWFKTRSAWISCGVCRKPVDPELFPTLISLDRLLAKKGYYLSKWYYNHNPKDDLFWN